MPSRMDEISFTQHRLHHFGKPPWCSLVSLAFSIVATNSKLVRFQSDGHTIFSSFNLTYTTPANLPRCSLVSPAFSIVATDSKLVRFSAGWTRHFLPFNHHQQLYHHHHQQQPRSLHPETGFPTFLFPPRCDPRAFPTLERDFEIEVVFRECMHACVQRQKYLTKSGFFFFFPLKSDSRIENLCPAYEPRRR